MLSVIVDKSYIHFMLLMIHMNSSFIQSSMITLKHSATVIIGNKNQVQVLIFCVNFSN